MQIHTRSSRPFFDDSTPFVLPLSSFPLSRPFCSAVTLVSFLASETLNGTLRYDMAIALGSRSLSLPSYRSDTPPYSFSFVRQRPSCLANQRSFLLSRLLPSSEEGQRKRRLSRIFASATRAYPFSLTNSRSSTECRIFFRV